MLGVLSIAFGDAIEVFFIGFCIHFGVHTIKFSVSLLGLNARAFLNVMCQHTSSWCEC